jgi:hypothetical protein
MDGNLINVDEFEPTETLTNSNERNQSDEIRVVQGCAVQLSGGRIAVPDEATIRILVHRQNIHRYKFLLHTPLTDFERAFINRRIAEEEAEVRHLTAHRLKPAGRAGKNNVPLEAATKADDHVTPG